MTQEEYQAIADEKNVPVEAVIAYEKLGIEEKGKFDDIEEAYAGEFPSDEEFARDMAEQIGENIAEGWPHYCIDWEFAARELMMDYSEQDGYYFRNI